MQKNTTQTQIDEANENVERLKNDLMAAEEHVRQIKEELEKANNDLEKKEETKWQEINDLWNSLNVYSKSLIQQSYWKGETDYPELKAMLSKVIIKDDGGEISFEYEAKKHPIFKYYPAFNPCSPDSGMYINRTGKATVLLKEDPRLEELESSITDNGGTLIDISNIEDANIDIVMQRFLPVVFFFKVEKGLENEQIIAEVKHFFEAKAGEKDCLSLLYELL